MQFKMTLPILNSFQLLFFLTVSITIIHKIACQYEDEMYDFVVENSYIQENTGNLEDFIDNIKDLVDTIDLLADISNVKDTTSDEVVITPDQVIIILDEEVITSGEDNISKKEVSISEESTTPLNDNYNAQENSYEKTSAEAENNYEKNSPEPENNYEKKSTEPENNYEKNSTETAGFLRPPQCGYSVQSQTRILGGEAAEVGAWPWMAIIGFYADSYDELGFACGATLISSRHVLTAGHCVYKDERYFVRLGEYDINSNYDGASPIDVSIEKITIHPDYSYLTDENDIAIVKLAKDVEFTDNIYPICLPVKDSIKNHNFVDHYLFATGWGVTDDGTPSDVLREIQIPVVDEESCKEVYRYLDGSVVVDERIICAGYAEGGKDTCDGDSGGPLMFFQKQTYYLIGIVSKGYRCAEPYIPGLYTRVTLFLDFILSNMN